MPISLGYIEQRLASRGQTAKRNKGFAKNFSKEGIDFNSRAAVGYEWTNEKVQDCILRAQKLKNDIIAEIQKEIPSFDASTVSFEAGMEKQGTGRILRFKYSFNSEGLWRDSLYQPSSNSKHTSGWQDYSKKSKNGNVVYGTDNIVLQFEKGWKASGSIKGTWHGNEVWSKRAREGSYMLYKAVKRFNQNADKHTKATLLGKYK